MYYARYKVRGSWYESMAVLVGMTTIDLQKNPFHDIAGLPIADARIDMLNSATYRV